MNKLELTALNCTNCGASISGYEGKNEVNCDYCGTLIKIVRPKEVKIKNQNLSSDNQDKLNNLVEILQKAMRAGNYKEGYDYCNKALEIDPSIGALWENKAICTFWQQINLFDDDKISLTDAKEIITYLRASKENDPDSETYAETADFIGYNLGLITEIKYNLNVFKDAEVSGTKGYTKGTLNKARKYHELILLSFEIMENKDTRFLEFIINDLSNNHTVDWEIWSEFINYDVEKKREIVINLIKKYKHDYTPPEVKKSKYPWHILIGIIVVVIVFIVMCTQLP